MLIPGLLLLPPYRDSASQCAFQVTLSPMPVEGTGSWGLGCPLDGKVTDSGGAFVCIWVWVSVLGKRQGEHKTFSYMNRKMLGC